MTEEEWATSETPGEMISFLRGSEGRQRLPDRVSRLLGVAFCRRVWDLITDSRSRRAVDVAERYADGKASQSELDAGYDEAFDVEEELAELVEPRTGFFEAIGRAANAAAEAAHPNELAEGIAQEALEALEAAGIRGEHQAQAALVRCIMGNPFRPVALDPSWRTSTVVALAEGIYADRAFDRLPILADALQDAGCANEDVLAHCRSAGPHARGCWVVDLILGRS